MDKKDIIRMAREAGLGDTGVREGFIFFQPGTDGLERFAALVAAHEREVCAKVADEQAQDEPYGHAKFRCGNIAAAIRARGEK